MKSSHEIACREERHRKESSQSSLSLEELVATNDADIVLLSWVQMEHRNAPESEAAEESHPVEESKDTPE